MAKRVLIISPGGLDLPGGITRMVRYFTEAWTGQPDAPDYEIVDSRGAGSVFWSFFYLLAAACRLVLRRLQGRVSLAHVNFSGGLSAIRKSFLILIASMLGIPIILHLHSGLFDGQFRSLPSPLKALVRFVFARAARVIVLGVYWNDFALRELRVPAGKIVVLPNAVPAAPTGPRQPSATCQLLFLGRLGAEKGLPELLAALADPRLGSARWTAVLAGDGEVVKCRQKAAALGIGDRVNIPGWVDAATVRQLLAGADILVLPSHYEGLPMSLLEAMSYGLAIVTTPVGSVGEAVCDGESALFVPVGDAAALAAALARLMGDPALRQRLGGAARARFEERFEVTGYARRLAALYREVTAAG